MKLLLSQKNTLFNQILECGMNPNQFEYSSDDYRDSIRFKNSEYHFDFCDVSGYAVNSAYYCPADKKYSDYKDFAYWQDCVVVFLKWIDLLKLEIAEEDKWGKLKTEAEKIKLGEFVDSNSFFTIQEHEIIMSSIHNLKLKIAEIDTLKDHLLEINKKLDHLLTMTKSLSKTDWRELFIGSIISTIMSLALDKQTVNQLWSIIKTFFNNILMIK